MMRQYELVERVAAYDPELDEDLLNRAYVYAMRAHGDQKRASGDPYFSHPLEVAALLTDLKLDTATITAALLHDVVEDTETTHQEIEKLFGPEIALLVEGLTKIKRLDLVTKEAAQAENLRKLLLAISKDIRVLLVKLADRLHNMRTLQYVRLEKRKRIAEETIDIYAPLAGRLGMQNIREELEDLSFQVLNPDAYATIQGRLMDLRDQSGDVLVSIARELKQKLKAGGISAEVFGREKKPYSIWRKMQRKSLALGQLSDIFGFRVIVADLDECYRALGLVHRTWRMVPGRFKDYISVSKQNNYQSIHTTVIGPHRQRVELQIRTSQMHEIAENGVAAHALYKDVAHAEGNGGLQMTGDQDIYGWLRRLLDILVQGDSPKEFLEHTKLELFVDQVFCFTPKGALIALPRGANAIDFAYAVHTDIGNSCVGCKINGNHAPLMHPLENGDEVEIIRSDAQTPPSAWEGLAQTGKARSAIRRANKIAAREQYASLGREMVRRAFEARELKHDDAMLETGFGRLGIKGLEDGLAAIGRSDVVVGDLFKALGLDETDSNDPRVITGRQKHRAGSRKGVEIPIRGARGAKMHICDKTGAVPGDRIVGIVGKNGQVTVYPIFAESLSQFEDQPDNWLDLRWDEDYAHEGLFPARINLMVHNEIGALGQIAQAVAEKNGNIDNLTLARRASDFCSMSIVVEVNDLKHLTEIVEMLSGLPVVQTVARSLG